MSYFDPHHLFSKRYKKTHKGQVIQQKPYGIVNPLPTTYLPQAISLVQSQGYKVFRNGNSLIYQLPFQFNTVTYAASDFDQNDILSNGVILVDNPLLSIDASTVARWSMNFAITSISINGSVPGTSGQTYNVSLNLFSTPDHNNSIQYIFDLSPNNGKTFNLKLQTPMDANTGYAYITARSNNNIIYNTDSSSLTTGSLIPFTCTHLGEPSTYPFIINYYSGDGSSSDFYNFWHGLVNPIVIVDIGSLHLSTQPTWSISGQLFVSVDLQ